MLWSFMELYGPFFPKAEVLQIIDFSSFNFWKSPFHAWGIVILPELVKILWWLPTLTGCSLPSIVATVLGYCSMGRALHSDISRCLNYCKTPLQTQEVSLWTQMTNFYQIWKNSNYNCPLWTAIACLPEVQLTCILFLWLANAKLMIWGLWIFAKLHSRPEIWAFENGFTKSATFAPTVKPQSQSPNPNPNLIDPRSSFGVKLMVTLFVWP